MSRRSSTLTTLSVAAALCAVGAAPAAAAGWSCDASALRGSVAGGASVEPVVANRGAEACQTAARTAETGLPVPLDGALVAGTSLQDGNVLAAGGVARLRAGLLPALGLPVPQVEIPASLGAVTVDLTGAGLPPLPSLPTSITIDLRPAVRALAGTRAFPSLELLDLQGAMAYASGTCRDGGPVLSGVAQVAGLKVLGRELPTDRATTQTIALLEAGVLDLSRLDLSLVTLPAALDTAGLRPLAEAALREVVTRLEDLPIPAALARVSVRPGEQVRSGDRLVQRALQLELDVLDRRVLDLTLGEAAVGAADVRCAAAEVLAATEAALACTKRRITLIDVLQRDGRVVLLGAADRSLAGRTVDLVLEATGRRVARAVVRPDGSFRATAPLPARALRATNDARYRAVVGRERSLNLKLQRRMVVERVTRSGGDVVISGRVVGPLAAPVRPITIQRRVTCSKYEVIGRVRPSRDGRFRAVVPAGTADQAVFRLGTLVRKTTRNPKVFPTFTLPRAVELG